MRFRALRLIRQPAAIKEKTDKKDASLDGESYGPKVGSSGVSSDTSNNSIPKTGEKSIKKDVSLDGVQPAVSDSSHGVSSDTSDNSIPQTGEKSRGKNQKTSAGAEEKGRDIRFKEDVTRYSDVNARTTVQNAVDSGILNDTAKTHDLVDLLAKISENKGVTFSFTNNARLKESGFALDGKTVNGYIDGGVITINTNSKKYLNTVVGHEITHVLEGDGNYEEFAHAITEYAKSRGEYETRLESIKKLYEGIERADIEAELVADLAGDYLFTDADFVNELSVKHRNIFQRIYDEIKYLCKLATAGSAEARELEKAKKLFAKVYNESGMAQKNTVEDGVRYSLGEIIDQNQNSYGIGVHLDSTFLDNLTPDERVGLVKEYIKELGGKTFTAYDQNGNAVDITIAKPGTRFINRRGKDIAVNKDLATKYIDNEVKQESIALIDELVLAADFKEKKRQNTRTIGLTIMGKMIGNIGQLMFKIKITPFGKQF